VKEISLSRGYFALVDDDDYERVMAAGPWHACPRGRTAYGQHNVRCDTARGWTTQGLHQFITDWSYVDHENGNGLDNQRSNLRQSTAAQNSHNRRTRIDSTSGFKGVFKQAGCMSKPWRAQIALSGKKKHLGMYATPEEAARAYDAAAAELFGEFARLNFPWGTG
jgi:hypothetical protein